MTRHGLLIIGGGPAAIRAASAYRQAKGAGAVAIVADEHRMPYRRPPLTKELLRGEARESELPLEREQWLAEHRVELVCGRAVALDSGLRRVTLSGGRELDYEWCLLATGGEPKRLPVAGADDPGVRVLRSLDHLRELNARLADGGPIVVIGSGFIGCEAAASLRRRDHPVTLVSDEPAPNATRLGEAPARAIATWLEADGVELRCGSPVESIERRGESLTVHAAATSATAAIVLMAAGIAPRGELAIDAGLQLEDGAIPTDATMRTADARLLAAGDVCVAHNITAGRRLRVEHWGEALRQGEIAGMTAAGEPRPWNSVPGFWSTIGDHILKYVAWGDGYDDAIFDGDEDGFTVRYERDGKLVGVLTHCREEDYELGGERIAAEAQRSR